VILDHVISLLYSTSGGVDFILCIGDDSADEYMFSALQERFGSSQSGSGPVVYTTVVGRKPSAANYYLNDPDEVLELCQSLRHHSTRANRNKSMGDLDRLHTERVWGRTGSRPANRRPMQGDSDLDWSRAHRPALYYN
jgi:hypothetical protein